MEIVKGKLISVAESDLKNGVFFNSKIKEIGDKCFSEMKALKKVVLPNCTKVGYDCFRSNASLTTIDLKALTTCGFYCFSYNDSLTTIDLKALTTCSYGCFSYNASLTTIFILKKELFIKNADGYCFIVDSIKSTKGIKIYSGGNFEKVQNSKIINHSCFVAEKSGFLAHGNSVKKAINDLQFKIVSEKLKNEPIKEDTKLTVMYYRTITGACDLGCRDFMEKNDIPFIIKGEETVEVSPIKAIDLLPILEKSKPYGFDKFKQLLDFSK